MRKPKSIVIYAADKKLTEQHVRLTPHPDAKGFGQGEVWLRTEIMARDSNDALDRAYPLLGETIMNSYQLPLDPRPGA